MVKRKHADLVKASIRNGEKAVQNLNASIEEFSCDPFDKSNTQLRTLQSGKPASDASIKDLKTRYDFRQLSKETSRAAHSDMRFSVH